MGPMRTSSVVPTSLGDAANACHRWAGEVSTWARRLASGAFPHAGLLAAAARLGALSGRSVEHATWTRSVAVAFAAADRDLAAAAARKRPAVRLPSLAIADFVARVTMLRAMAAGAAHPGNAALSRLLSDHAGRYLRVDPRGDGLVVEVFGDLTHAKHVVVLVPGMSNDIGNYPTTLRRRALSLLAAMRREAGDEPVAVIAWLGYDTPGLAAAMRSGVAHTAAKQLVLDVAAIRNTYPGAHLSVVGHSYGSVVLGQAMKAGLDAPTAVVVGSPGMDADARTELGSRNMTLWAAKAKAAISVHVVPVVGIPLIGVRVGDLVAWAPVHGEDPAAGGFGARPFPVGAIDGHGSYFKPGTTSLRSIARIAVSKRP